MNKIFWLYHRSLYFVFPWEFFYRLKQFFWNNVIDRYISNYYTYNGDFIINKNYKITLYKYKKISKYNFYGVNLDYNNKINWRKDYVNNITSKISHFSLINKNNFNQVGELKIALEPSRFNFLPSYVNHYLTVKSKNKFLNYSPIKHMKDWNTQNPFLKSFNWSDGIEVAIRSINLSYSILIIHDNDKLLFNQNSIFFKELMLKHSYFLRHHLSLYSSAGNHLVAELIGILILSLSFNLNINYQYYFNLLLKITPDQFYEDGFSKEQSTHYFKDNLSLYLILLSKLRSHNKLTDFDKLLKSIRNSLSFFKDLRIKKSLFFDLGDNDNSIIINDILSDNFCEYESVLKDILHLQYKKINKDFRNHLLWNHIFFKNPKMILFEPYSIKYYNKSNYVFINRNPINLLLNYSNLGIKFMGAHGHSDLMSFQLYVDKFPFFIDNGTFQYHSKYIKIRNFFRSVCSHNVSTIDNKNHSNILSNMMWDKITKVENIKVINNKKKFTISGFFKFSSNKNHNRTFTIINNSIVIDDVFNTNTNSNFQIYFQLHPKVIIKKTNKHSFLLSHPNTNKNLLISLQSKNFNIDLFSGSKKPLLGWFSPEYRVMIPSTCIKVSGNFNDKIKVKSIIKIL